MPRARKAVAQLAPMTPAPMIATRVMGVVMAKSYAAKTASSAASWRYG
jgi:hypothetical protein